MIQIFDLLLRVQNSLQNNLEFKKFKQENKMKT
jgi:hypothetical protein